MVCLQATTSDLQTIVATCDLLELT